VTDREIVVRAVADQKDPAATERMSRSLLKFGGDPGLAQAT